MKMRNVILTTSIVMTTLLTGCANMQQMGQNQQATGQGQVVQSTPQPQPVPVEQRAYKGKVQDKKTDFPMYGIHQGEKPVVVFQGIVLNVQPYQEGQSGFFKGVNSALGAIDKSLKIKDPNAVQMMDITIGTANKQQFHFKQAMQPGFVKGHIVLVVQFANGDTVLDPDLNKSETIK